MRGSSGQCFLGKPTDTSPYYSGNWKQFTLRSEEQEQLRVIGREKTKSDNIADNKQSKFLAGLYLF